MSEIPVIAIDGTAASGKGTLARRLAEHLDYAYLDTGLLYRCVAATLIAQGIPTDDHKAAIQAARTLDPAKLNDPELRSGASGRGASVVAAIPEVRQALFDFQRAFPAKSGKAGPFWMDVISARLFFRMPALNSSSMPIRTCAASAGCGNY